MLPTFYQLKFPSHSIQNAHIKPKSCKQITKISNSTTTIKGFFMSMIPKKRPPLKEARTPNPKIEHTNLHKRNLQFQKSFRSNKPFQHIGKTENSKQFSTSKTQPNGQHLNSRMRRNRFVSFLRALI